MRLKVYQAPNAGAAMALIRDELGPDALILASRSVDDGVEITAACDGEEPPRAPAAPAATAAPVAMPTARAADLGWHGVPAALQGRLDPSDLATSLAGEFDFCALPCQANNKPLLLVGPPGAGKTMTTARLAARLKRAGQDALVITADGRRAGAAEQLAAFTRLLGLQLIVADTAAQLPKAWARREGGAPVVIDMPGTNPVDPVDQAFLRDAKSLTGGQLALVLPAGLDVAEAEELATGFRDVGARFLVATRLDQSRRLGGILVAAATAGLALTEAGISASVADGSTPMTAEFLADRLIRTSPAPKPSVRPLPLAMLARSRREASRHAP